MPCHGFPIFQSCEVTLPIRAPNWTMGRASSSKNFRLDNGFSLGPTQRTPVFGPRDCFASPIGKATSKNPRGDTREPWKIAFWKATTEILQIRYQGTSGDVDESAQSWWVKGRVDRAQPDMHQNVKRSEAMRTEHGNCLQQEQRLKMTWIHWNIWKKAWQWSREELGTY